MSNGKMVVQSCEILKKTYAEINKMREDLKEIFQDTTPQMEFFNEYSYKTTELRVRDWHVILFGESSRGSSEEKNGNFFIMVFILCNNSVTKDLTVADEPELWCGLVELTNSKQGINLWDAASITKEKTCFTPERLETGGSVYKYFYDEKDKYGKYIGKFVGYKLTDVSSREILEKLIVNKLFSK
jgi:hypothetical protein